MTTISTTRITQAMQLVLTLGIGIGLGLGIQYAIAAYTTPPSGPPSGNITTVPLTTGSDTQTKAGGLQVSGQLRGNEGVIGCSNGNCSYLRAASNGHNYLRGNTYLTGILYDENDTSYYVNPNSVTRLQQLQVSSPSWSLLLRDQNHNYNSGKESAVGSAHMNDAYFRSVGKWASEIWDEADEALNSYTKGSVVGGAHDTTSCPFGQNCMNDWGEVTCGSIYDTNACPSGTQRVDTTRYACGLADDSPGTTVEYICVQQ